jgi:putative drug exporter of the RND superfamily
MSQYLYRLARFAFRRRRLVLAVWLVAVIAAIALAVGSGGKTNDTFTIPGTEAQNATSVLTAKLPAFSGGQTTIVFATANGAKVTSPADEAAINSAMTAMKKIPQVSAVVSPFQSHLVSRDGTMALGQVQWSAQPASVTTAQLNAVTAAIQPLAARGVQAHYNGSVYPGWTFKLSEAPELVGLAIAFVILLITLGVIAAAGMPIAGAVIGVVITLMGVTAVAALTAVASEATTVALMLGLSTGVDYGLFILSRRRANLLAGMTPEESAGRAVGTAGSAVVFAALTVMIALAGLTMVGVPFLTVMGLSAAVAVAISLLIALTLLPALLGFAGRRVISFTRLPLLSPRARRVASRAVTSPDTLASARWGRFVVRHRLLMLLGGIAILGVLAIPATRLQLGLPSGSNQPAGNTQRIAYDQTTQGFGAGYNGPLLIVAQDVHSPAATQQLAANLAKLPDVANVTPAWPPRPRVVAGPGGLRASRDARPAGGGQPGELCR